MGKYVWMYFQAFFVLFLAILLPELILFSKSQKINSQVGGVETDECDKNMSEFQYSAQKLCALQKIHTFPHSRDLLYCYLHDMSS